MQNPYMKYLKHPNGTQHVFYHENSCLYLRSHGENGWSASRKIAEQISPMFSICQYKNVAYLLYATLDGQLFLTYTSDFTSWDSRAMAGGLPNPGRTKFFMIPLEDTFHIIYHTPSESTGVEYLIYTSFRNGQWEQPYQIDRFMPFGKTPFFVRRLRNEHIILYYRTARNAWSAREMLLSPYTMGSLTPLIQTPSSCIDISIVNDAERIHILYIVRGMFRTQVVYQYKQTVAISTPRVLWEDANCDNCLVSLENGKVVLMWTVNNQPFRCVSENNGTSFGSVERFTGNFPTQCIKGEYIGAEDNIYNASESYGDIAKGYLPFPFHQETPQQQQPKKAPLPDQQKVLYALQETHKKEVAELSTLLAQRSDELSAINAKWHTQIVRLEEELRTLREENTRLQHTISSMSHTE